jgi:hypothetical protein
MNIKELAIPFEQLSLLRYLKFLFIPTRKHIAYPLHTYERTRAVTHVRTYERARTHTHTHIG